MGETIDIKNNIEKVFSERKKKKQRKEEDEGTQKIEVPNYMIPKGGKLVECYLTETQIIVIDDIDSEDETHNCDQMGCSSLSHVKYRFDLEDSWQNKYK